MTTDNQTFNPDPDATPHTAKPTGAAIGAIKQNVRVVEPIVEISTAQARQFAYDLFYSTDLIADIRKYVDANKEAYADFQSEGR